MTDLRDLYGEIETAVRPVILSHASKISRALSIPMDDAIQECSVALFKGLAGYDFNRSHGGIHRFAHVVLKNSAASIITGATTTAKVPNVIYTEDGETKVVKRRALASLDELVDVGEGQARSCLEPADHSHSPEDAIIASQLDQRRAKLRMRLINKLTPREKEVFTCLSSPKEAFLIFMRNTGESEVTHTVIADYLGVSKNSVDYAGYGVRTKFTKLAEREFPDLIEGHLERGTWPMIHISRRDKPDHEFVTRTIRERALDPRPDVPARDIELAGEWAREVQNYSWGSVVILRRGNTYRTLIIEGKFNRLSGGVSGTDGTWKQVQDVVPWYPKLVRELKK